MLALLNAKALRDLFFQVIAYAHRVAHCSLAGASAAQVKGHVPYFAGRAHTLHRHSYSAALTPFDKALGWALGPLTRARDALCGGAR